MTHQVPIPQILQVIDLNSVQNKTYKWWISPYCIRFHCNNDLFLNISDAGTCPAPVIPANSTDDDNDNGDFKFDWDTDTQSMVLGCFFYGYVLTQMPGGTLGK